MLKVVIDTQLLLRSLVKENTLSHKIIRGNYDKYQLLYNDETRAEILDVVTRPKTRRKFTMLSNSSITLLDERYSRGIRVTLDHPIPKIVRDPKDDIFLATAFVGEADYLVTQDKDLLVLETYGTTKIVDLPTFWSVLQSLPDEE